MPLRAPKMYGFIFGFQRLVWWPKWTPASSNWRMVMPCAGCMACCMPVASAPAGGVLGDGPGVWTFSDIVFSPPPPSRPKQAPVLGNPARIGRCAYLDYRNDSFPPESIPEGERRSNRSDAPWQGWGARLPGRCRDHQALAAEDQDIEEAKVGPHVRKRRAGSLRLRLGHRLAVARLAPAGKISSPVKEQRQADGVPAGLSGHLALPRILVGAVLERR